MEQVDQVERATHTHQHELQLQLQELSATISRAERNATEIGAFLHETMTDLQLALFCMDYRNPSRAVDIMSNTIYRIECKLGYRKEESNGKSRRQRRSR